MTNCIVAGWSSGGNAAWRCAGRGDEILREFADGHKLQRRSFADLHALSAVPRLRKDWTVSARLSKVQRRLAFVTNSGESGMNRDCAALMPQLSRRNRAVGRLLSDNTSRNDKSRQ